MPKKSALGISSQRDLTSSSHPSSKNDDVFVKHGDLIFLNASVPKCHFYGDGTKGRCVGREVDDQNSEANFLNTVFRLQPKHEYAAKKELAKFQAANIEDPVQLKRINERVELENKQNAAEETENAGQVITYGQIVQLVHIRTNTFLYANKHERASLDPSALKVDLRKQGSKDCWFKILPKFRVRVEGERVHKGDQVVLLHVKSGQFVYLSNNRFPDKSYEVTLYNQQSGWIINHYSSYIPSAGNYINGGSVTRLFYPEVDGVLESRYAPLYNNPQHQVFLKTKSKGKPTFTSSNSLFLVEQRNTAVGGPIAWTTPVRFKHMGTDKYLILSRKPFTKDPNVLSLALTDDVSNDDTLFTLVPVDKMASSTMNWESFFRIQHYKTGYWMHLSNLIEPKDKKSDDFASFKKKRNMEIHFTETSYYEDMLSFQHVPEAEVDDLSYVTSLYASLDEFCEMLKKRNSADVVTTILVPETDAVCAVFVKLIRFINSSTEEDPHAVNGLPLSAHQKLLKEQQFIEISMDILAYLFGGSPKRWKEDKDMKTIFKENVSHPDNQHLLAVCKLVNKFIQLMAKGNSKIGLFMSGWLDLLLLQIGAGTGTRVALIEMFRDNFNLLNTFPKQYINAFIKILMESEHDAKILEFLTALCACGDIPILHNQMYILENLIIAHPELMLQTKFNPENAEVSVNVQNTWMTIETLFIAGADDHDKRRKTTRKPANMYAFPYNPKLMNYIEYFKQMLRLFAKLSVGGNQAVQQAITEGNENLAPIVTLDHIVACMENAKLPGSLRALYADLLFVWLDPFLPAKPQLGVKYTWSWNELRANYEHQNTKESYSIEKKEENWLHKNLAKVQQIGIGVLKSADGAVVAANKEANLLYLSLLKVVDKLIKFGFLITMNAQEAWLPILFDLLDSKQDLPADNTRFQLDEYTALVMEAKQQICYIMHSYFDLNLEEKTAETLHEFRDKYENPVSEEPEKEVKEENNLSLIARTSFMLMPLNKKETKGSNSDQPSQGQMRRQQQSKMFKDKDLINILLDLLLYQHPGLATSALSLLLRHARPYDELVTTIDQVQLLTDEESLRVYQTISQGLNALRNLLKDNDISEDDDPLITKILKNFIELCCTDGNLNTPNIKNQTIFKNLAVHEMVLKILHLPYNPSYKEIFKLCYLFIKQWVQGNRANQALAFPHIEFMLSQMGYKLNISDVFIEILSNNHQLASQVDASFIQHMVKLIVAHGRKRKYLAILNTIVEAEGKFITDNQNQVITLIMQNNQSVLWLYPNLKRTKRTGSVDDSKTKKITLDQFIANEKARVRDDDEEDLLYHIQLIELFARCCLGYNHMPEMLCQTVVPISVCLDILSDPKADIVLKTAYCKFAAEVWLYTERTTGAHTDDRSWSLLNKFADELAAFTADEERVQRRDPDDFEYIFRGILAVARVFYSNKFDPEAITPAQLKITNHLLEVLQQMLNQFSSDAKNFPLIVNVVQSLADSNIEGIQTEYQKVSEILRRAKGNLSTLHESALENVAVAQNEERKILSALSKFKKQFAKKEAKPGKLVLDAEFEDIVRVFKDKLLKEKETKYTEKLIAQFSKNATQEVSTKLKIDCLALLEAMITTEDAPSSSITNLFSSPPEEEHEQQMEEVQNMLGSLKVLDPALELLHGSDQKLIYGALKLLASLLAGGNKYIQKLVMDNFLLSADPMFFDDIRNRLIIAANELKAFRRQAQLRSRRKSVSVSKIEEQEISSAIEKKRDGGFLDLTLLMLQNLCEGHNTKMKDYLRDQYDNSKSFNLVKECAIFANELERSIEENIPLGIQLFRTLNEFASGCPQNQITLIESKIYNPISRILQKFAEDNAEDALRLKISMTELLISLVEGQFPERVTETSFIPPVLVGLLDFKHLEESMDNAWKVCEPYTIKPGQMVRTSEKSPEAENALEFISDCMILLKILNEYDSGETVSTLLNKESWAYFGEKGIGSIEILDETSSLQRVYFKIPDICRNLNDKSKETLMRSVNRDSPTEKLEDFVQKGADLNFEIRHQTKVNESRLAWISTYSQYWRYALVVLTLTLNIMMAGYYHNANGLTTAVVIDDSGVEIALIVFAALHAFFSILMVSSWMWNFVPLILYHGRKEHAEEMRQLALAAQKKGASAVLKEQLTKRFLFIELLLRDLKYLFTDGWFIYHFLYLFVSLCGLTSDGRPAYAFHLLDLSLRSEQVRNVLKSVTLNGKSILLTALLALILIYLYAAIGFFFLRSTYDGLDCNYLFECFLTTINFGIRSGGGIGDVLQQVEYHDDLFWQRFFFDLTFFAIIIIILLNIVFGIILDTFGQLRDEKNMIDADIKGRCFICSIDSAVFQRQSLGFKHHIQHEHKMWNYLYYFIYLDTKDKDEYTAAEEYVFEKREKGEIDFFPDGRSIALETFDNQNE